MRATGINRTVVEFCDLNLSPSKSLIVNPGIPLAGFISAAKVGNTY